jgi:hypothetical protein
MLIDNPKGNYRFLRGIAPYSSGVVAMPAFEIIHVKFLQPPPLLVGFERIVQHLGALNRPVQSLCGMELRIPAPLSFDGFRKFNEGYQEMLIRLNLLVDEVNPIARTNIAQSVFPVTEPSIHAFSYTIPVIGKISAPTFIVAGAGDLRDQSDLSAAAIVRPGETSDQAMRVKAATVMQVMHERLLGLEVSWLSVTNLDVYTVQPLHAYLVDTIYQPIGAAVRHGVNWYFSHPPIEGLAFEMDMRGVRQEHWIAP